MRVIAPCPGERSAHAIRTSRCGMLEQRVRKKVVTTTYAYDNNGNVIRKTTDGTTTTYVCNYANRLIALGAAGATTTYGYDWAGNRVYQTGTTTTYLYPFKWYSVASSTGSGAKFATTTDYVFNGDSLVATVDQETASGNCVIFGLRAFEQVEFQKPRHRVEVAITRQPYVFESLLRPFDDAESVHGDKHREISW